MHPCRPVDTRCARGRRDHPQADLAASKRRWEAAKTKFERTTRARRSGNTCFIDRGAQELSGARDRATKALHENATKFEKARRRAKALTHRCQAKVDRDRLVEELQLSSQEYVNCTDEYNERQRTYYTQSLADTLNVPRTPPLAWLSGAGTAGKRGVPHQRVRQAGNAVHRGASGGAWLVRCKSSKRRQYAGRIQTQVQYLLKFIAAVKPTDLTAAFAAAKYTGEVHPADISTPDIARWHPSLPSNHSSTGAAAA